MAHHKRKGPKSTRAGCLLCKPHKRQGARETEKPAFGELRRLQRFSAPLSRGRPATRSSRGLTAALPDRI